VIDGKARAYPIGILNYHEAVNDKLAGEPICVIYCPLCDSASIVDRRVGEKTYEFGISGLLYNSNVLLYDRTDDALWSQVYLKAVSGPNAGTSLQHLDNWAITTFKRFKQRHPDGSVLTFDTGHTRDYTRNPYEGYFKTERLMFPVEPIDKRLPTKTVVIGILYKEVARAYPLDALAEAADEKGLFHDTIAGEVIELIIEPKNETVVVHKAPEGAQNVHTFWYAWAAFHPKTEVWGVEEDEGDE
ncbi:MAG: DUF3179 domain-containing protein, partial [Rhodospirillales bacterium]|nr:DUF3179 domain-containing protein [Rhodospirillales bacterium]